MDKYTNNKLRDDRLIILTSDSLTFEINDPDIAIMDIPTTMLSAGLADDLYHEWAATDFCGSFFNYVCTRDHDKVVCLTHEDLAIFHRAWMRDAYPAFDAMLDGDAQDSEIFDYLGDAAAEGGTCLNDYNFLEEASYVFWDEKTKHGFDPIYLS